MPITVDGFEGGDRTHLKLPKTQRDLMQAVAKTGKPVILVLLNGSALAVNWADENLDAIISAGYPGQEGGNAVADVLFGDYNPAGRLPVRITSYNVCYTKLLRFRLCFKARIFN